MTEGTPKKLFHNLLRMLQAPETKDDNRCVFVVLTLLEARLSNHFARPHHTRFSNKGSRWYGGNNASSVFFVDRPARSEVHPTMKPVALIAAQLSNSSLRGDAVLDLFAGSGSTLIACERLGRRCFAVELDPAYCDVIRQRYEDYTHGR